MAASSWPWMKDGAVPAILPENPTPPVTVKDNRPSVKVLIDEHRQLIDQVAKELSTDPLYESNKHDDLWIVRFLLSHKKKVKPSVKAAKFTLVFRKEHKLDEKDIRFSPVDRDAPSEALQRFLKHCGDDTFRFVVPDPKRGVIGFLRAAGIDQHALVEHVDAADWLPCFTYIAEWSHQWLDYITRTTGRLTKSVRIVDAADISLAGINNENNKRDGQAMHIMEDCYPQMLQTVFVCHAPGWIQVPWRVLRPLIPKRVVEKFDFVAPETNIKERKRLLKYISLQHLPARFGGLNETWPVEFAPPSIDG